MHILTVHGPYFAKEANIAIWSTQGMERSHWKACFSFQRTNNHGGGQGIEETHEDRGSHQTMMSNPMV